MSRPWIKLHTAMLHHPGIGRLSDRAHRAWITMLLMAAESEDLGAIGSVADVAWMIHATEQDVDAALGELGGRIVRDGDLLRIRDWGEWQEPVSAAERMRALRSRQRDAAVTHVLHTERNEVPITCDAQTQTQTQTEDPDTDPDQQRGAADAAPPPADAVDNSDQIAPTKADLHDALFEAVCTACGWSTHHLAEVDRSNAGKLARELARADPAWVPRDVYMAGTEWKTVKFRHKPPAQVRPPTIAQLRTWLGECETRWYAEAPFEAAVLR